MFDFIKTAIHKCNEDRTARFSAITICYATLAVNTKHQIRQALVDKGIHNDLNVLLAASCDFAKFHAGLAMAVLVHDENLKPTINFTNPLPELFLSRYTTYDAAEAFRERYCRRYAFGIKETVFCVSNNVL